MPKDRIYSTDSATAVVEHVAVGWTRDRDVQLGVIPGPQVDVLIDGKPLDEGLSGLWMGLDREGCNRLIRSVRKARDAAYGQDA